MTDSLTTRLLAEIERRHEQDYYRYWHGESTGAQEAMKYLAALRKVVEIHQAKEVRVYGADLAGGAGWLKSEPAGPYAIELDCTACDECLEWPCPTITAIATALDVTP